MADTTRALIEAILRADASASVVGGAVRDRLLGRRVTDVDVTVGHPTDEVVRSVSKLPGFHAAVLDRERGYVRLTYSGDDANSVAHALHIDLTSHGGDLRADLACRDFTINSMAVPAADWLAHWHPNVDDHTGAPMSDAPGLIDPHGGRSDIERRRIRSLGMELFLHDPVRMMRAVRFAGQLDFAIDDEVSRFIRENSGELGKSSPDRSRDELYAIFSTPAAYRGIVLLDDLGLIDQLLPELVEGRGVTQPRSHHYYDVYWHSIHAVEKVDLLLDAARSGSDETLGHIPWRPDLDSHFAQIVGNGQTRLTLLRMAALLHDVAKPRCKTIDETGRVRFLGHDELGSEMVAEILARLRCSRKVATHVSTMVRHHLRPALMTPGRGLAGSADAIVNPAASPSRRAIYRYYRDLGPVAVDTLYLNMSDYLSARGPDLISANGVEDWRDYSQMIGDILSTGLEAPRQSRPFLLLDGNQIMSELGLRSGPKIGQLLSELRDAEADGTVQTRQEALEFLRRLV